MSISRGEQEVWMASSPPTSPPTSSSVRCGAEISNGMMSYRCSLGIGHAGVPASDPEPHYTTEVHRTVKPWREWAEREWQRRREAAAAKPVYDTPPHVATARGRRLDTVIPQQGAPTCSIPECDISMAHTHGTDPSADHQQGRNTLRDLSGTPRSRAILAMEDSLSMNASKEVLSLYEANNEDIQSGSVHWVYDEHCLARDQEPSLPNSRCFLCRPLHLLSVTEEDVPTKTRDGDQRLPEGGQECVQDLVIAEMEESKRVGTERYGSPLMTFNGRRSIQDVAEEVRDLHVYLTQVKRESEADRETLIKVVEKALTDYPGQSRLEGHTGNAAVKAVDAIMGWVVGQRQNPEAT